MRKNKSSIVLGERDIFILHFLFEHRIATLEQIGRKFFPNCKLPTFYQRLSKLSNAGYLKRGSIVFLGKKRNVFELTERGMQTVAKSYPLKITNSIYKSDSPIHDLYLVDLKQRLLRTQMVIKCVSENVLQACEFYQISDDFRPFVDLNSDAVLILDTKIGKLNVAFEFENSDKSIVRYAKKLREYYMAKVRAVFYVCTTGEIEDVIRHAEKDVAAEFNPKVFLCQLKNFQNEKQELVFVNRNNDTFQMI